MLQIKMWIIILFFKAQGLRIFDRLIFATAKCEICDLFPILTSASGCSHDGGDSRVVCQLLPAGSISISDFWDKESKSNRWRRDSGSGSVMLPPSTATPPQTCKRCLIRPLVLIFTLKNCWYWLPLCKLTIQHSESGHYFGSNQVLQLQEEVICWGAWLVSKEP